MTGVAIVAVPSEDDAVWRYSSEKIPHMTMLFLGDIQDQAVLDRIETYLAHVVSTSMHRFGMSVERRGELGPENADVLFFNKGYMSKELENARGYMLQNDDILLSYLSTDQYQEWTPHLTMGYPASPAKPDDRDYPGFHWVNFDKIMLWTGEFSGPEFVLPSDDRMAMSSVGSVVTNFLAHHGVKGMKWGVHRSRDELASSRSTRGKLGFAKKTPASEDAKAASAYRKTAKKNGTQALSNKELQALVTRMNLEQQYGKLSSQGSKKTAGSKWLGDFMTEVGKTVASEVLKDGFESWVKSGGSRSSSRHYASQVTVNQLGRVIKTIGK